jgi:TolA-binding protein
LGEFSRAREALSDYISRYPQGAKLARAKSLLVTATKRVEALPPHAADAK